MYETHFGLNNRVFHGTPTGSGIFVGPQTARVMAGLKKALVTADAAIAVTGPVGVGKTTAVSRALAAAGGKHVVISVGRVHLGQDEVLDQMLEELGANGLATGAIRKITVFRQALKQLQDKNARVVVIVEDAVRTGIETLAELEALTGADSGVSDGANIVLMGDDSLQAMLRAPELARLEQRTRMRQTVDPFSAGETKGYLIHCLREAGGEYEELFTEGCAELLHDLSGGVARVVNNLVESVLVSAAEQSLTTIDTALIRRVANDEYGLSSELVVTESTIKSTIESTAESTDEPANDLSSSDAPTSEKADEAGAGSPAADELVSTVVSTNEKQAVEPAESGKNAATEIPELIQDTQPALAALPNSQAIQDTRPEPATMPESGPIRDTESEPAAVPEPELLQDTQTELTVLPEPPETVEGEEPAATPAVVHDELPDLAELSPTLATGKDVEADVDSEEAPSVTEPAEEQAFEPEQTAAELKALQAAADQALAEIPELSLVPDTGEVPELVLAPEADVPETGAAPELTLDREPHVPEAGEVPELGLGQERAATGIPELTPEQPVQASPGADKGTAAAHESNLPDWDRDPTLAELRPDIEALEQAMAVAGEPEPAAEEPDPVVPAPTSATPPEPAIDGLEDIPEITLDASIRQTIDAAEESLHSQEESEETTSEAAADIADAADTTDIDDTADADTAPDEAPAAPNEELRRIASELAKARSIEDVDDELAETLFGEDLNLIAAEVTTNPPANDELELAAAMPAAIPAETSAENDEAAGDTATEMEQEFEQLWGKPTEEVSIDSSDSPAGGGLDLSASQRLATVRALNSGGTAAAPAAASNDNGNAGPSPQPEPIEEQISTSMTQTLKALNVRKMQGADEPEGEEKKAGFFSRFRRT